MKREHWKSYRDIERACARGQGKCPVCFTVDNEHEGMLCRKHCAGWALIERDYGGYTDERDAYVAYCNECIDNETGMWYRALRNWLGPRKTFSENP